MKRCRITAKFHPGDDGAMNAAIFEIEPTK